MSLFLNDRALLDEFRAGGKSAKEAVYRTYVDDVTKLVRYGFAAGGVGRVPGFANHSERLDIIQDVFVRAFSETARLGYDGLRPYRSYLLQIARNLIIDRVRKSGREVSADVSGAIDLDAVLARNSPLPSMEAELDQKMERAAAARFVASLTSDMQEFVHLRFYEGLAQETVGEALGLSRQNIRTMEKKVIEGLLRYLEQSPEEAKRQEEQPETAARAYSKAGGKP